MLELSDKIIGVHRTLANAGLAHAFGGALALAWCTQRARGTIDIDVNVFVPNNQFGEVLAALPAEVKVTAADRRVFKRDGQARLWWDHTPLDVFLNTTALHDSMAERVQWESFAGTEVPFLCCQDLAVFKVFFNRTKDWADLEEMFSAGTLDVDAAASLMALHMGTDDERVMRLRALPSD